MGTLGGPKAPSSAGRFDIGPEYLIPQRDKLWAGEWQAEVIGPRAVRLTSQPDDATGVQLIRNFRLAANGSHLACEQIIKNISQEPKYWAHWSRTFAVHGGIGIVPQTPDTRRFPNGFVMYNQGADHSIILRPTDPNVRMRGDFLEVRGPTRFPKLGFDSNAGWFAYVMPHDQAFVKRFPSPKDGVYPEIAGLTLCFWYPKAEQVPACELEPHGPRQTISDINECAQRLKRILLAGCEYGSDRSNETKLKVAGIHFQRDRKSALDSIRRVCGRN